MIKLSELRPIIKELNKNGWYRVKGQRVYLKEWTYYKLQYRQVITIFEIINLNATVSKFLNYYEQKATRELKKAYEEAMKGF